MDRRAVLRSIGVTVGAASTAGCIGRGGTPRTILGVFPGDGSSIRPFERWLERRVAVVTIYAEMLRDDPSRRQLIFETMTSLWDGGRVPMLTWEPFPRTDASSGSSVTAAIADGAYDAVLEGWMADLGEWLSSGSADRRFYFRPFPEMNGDWVPWGAGSTTPEDFVAAWRHLHEVMADASLARSDVQWIWNPNVTEHGAHDTESYYPGDDHVDWIGVDGYNFGDSQPWSTWESPEEIFDPMLARMEDLADKPLCIPELGSSSYRDGRSRPAEKSDWIDDVFDLVERRDVRMTSWFDVDKETDWAVFGGRHGTDTYRDERRSRTFDVYDAYRERVTAERYLAGDENGHLSTTAFRGQS